MNSYQITFQPGGFQVVAAAGSNLKEIILQSGMDFDFPCGGNGKCGKCRVKILEGIISSKEKENRHLSSWEIEQGVRLACKTEVQGDLTVELLAAKKVRHQILLTSVNRKVELQPPLRKRYFEAEKPAITDCRSDWQRLCDNLTAQGESVKKGQAPLALLRELPQLLRYAEFKATAVVHEGKITGVEAGDTAGNLLGMAFDIGTTSIVGYLMDLYTGEELAVVSTLNPQARYGADVISRIAYANQEGGLEKLNRAVIETAINPLISEAAKKAGVKIEDVYAVTVVGNSVMQHLFLGINPYYIARSPYIPAVCDAMTLNPIELNIRINPAGKVFVLPCIGGYVGADTVAAILANELDRREDMILLLDIGTNGEIVLGTKNRLVACAAAAGPAFEGAQISCGMRGAEGAIDHVSFNPELHYSVIGNVKPAGICGSALLDIVAGLLTNGMIDSRGRILPPVNNLEAAARQRQRIIPHEGAWAFLVADGEITAHGNPILITQNDIRQLQMAKGAIAAGIQILMDTLKVKSDHIKEVILAGAFGNYLEPNSACDIGLIPKELEKKVNMVGNAAGSGAKLALVAQHEFQRARKIAEMVEYIELSTHPGFTKIFAKAMYF